MHCFRIQALLLSLITVSSEVVGEPAVPTATPADECSSVGSPPGEAASSDQPLAARWIRYDHCQYKEKELVWPSSTDSQWCMVVVDSNAQECLDLCRLTVGCEAVNLVPLVNPARVYFETDVHIPASCNTNELKSSVQKPESAQVCYGFQLAAGDWHSKSVAHTISKDPEDSVSYSSCYRFQDSEDLAAKAAAEALLVKCDVGALWTPDRLAVHGPHHKQLFISVIGEVFDVSRGAAYYSTGGHYSIFSGRDGSRAFATGEFNADGAIESLKGLEPAHVHAVVNWLHFYRRDYIPAGKLVGRYFDEHGEPTAERTILFEGIDQSNDRSLPLYPGATDR